jgi:hypothetical protein
MPSPGRERLPDFHVRKNRAVEFHGFAREVCVALDVVHHSGVSRDDGLRPGSRYCQCENDDGRAQHEVSPLSYHYLPISDACQGAEVAPNSLVVTETVAGGHFPEAGKPAPSGGSPVGRGCGRRWADRLNH